MWTHFATDCQHMSVLFHFLKDCKKKFAKLWECLVKMWQVLHYYRKASIADYHFCKFASMYHTVYLATAGGTGVVTWNLCLVNLFHVSLLPLSWAEVLRDELDAYLLTLYLSKSNHAFYHWVLYHPIESWQHTSNTQKHFWPWQWCYVDVHRTKTKTINELFFT